MQNNGIVTLSVEKLLQSDDTYLIPLYQRNFAWGEGEISQLVQDIIDSIPEKGISKEYYLGILVVFERKNESRYVFETVDGQQRLTTLAILTSVINNFHIELEWFKNINLEFENRKISTQTLQAIFRNSFEKNVEYHQSLKDAYELSERIIRQKLNENPLVDHNRFKDFFFNHVKLLRVPLPNSTDLNHYFEVMNNRGEQLEKHEVLKSNLMDILYQDSENDSETSQKHLECFHLIWEACSNMEKYVQQSFTPSQRNKLFGDKDWNHLQASSFEEVYDLLCERFDGESSREKPPAITDIISSNDDYGSTHQNEDEENPDRFNSVINFSNFLLHVLRIQLQTDIPLDDKRLIDTFNHNLNPVHQVKEFAFNLLKIRFLFDQFVIKREYVSGEDNWSLKKLRKYDTNKTGYVNTFEDAQHNEEEGNRQALMLLAMFHVSNPSLVYKHWLNAVLFYVFNTPDTSSNTYIAYLESLVKVFVFDRFLTDSPESYYNIIYKNQGSPRNTVEDLNLDYLKFDNIPSNLIFNYLDYLLWREKQSEDSNIKEFEFTFRSSVEHYYPREPLEGQDSLEKHSLNSFGNLCLISHSKNSRLSNFMPTAKKEYYNNMPIDSIKQYKMMTDFEPSSWDKHAINEHEEEMVNLIKSHI